MNAQQVKQIASEWLKLNMAQYPGLRGAHFVGSVNTFPDEAHFPSYKDVDFHLVFSDGSPALENRGPFANLLETEYRGVILEGGYKPVSDYSTPEMVLANPEIAHHLTVDSLMYDPDGWLRGLQEPVRREYARRKWVISRVEFERKGLEQWQGLRHFAHERDSSGFSEIGLLGYHLSYLVALLCVATLQSPSSEYSRMRDILLEYNRLDLYEEAIAVLSFQNISSDQAEQLLKEGAEAFDLAVQVRRSPHPFQHKLNPHQRSYFVDKCRSLLDAGLVEQAVGWMIAYYGSSINVILADGPNEVKPMFAMKIKRLMEMLGAETQAARDERYLHMLRLDEQFFKLAEDIIDCNAAIFD
jgi:hypothetical protein